VSPTKRAVPGPAVEGELHVEYMPLSGLKGAHRNPKGHDIGAIDAAFKRFGYITPMVMNERTGRLVAGHGRRDTLQQAKASGRKPPARIVERDGEWFVPVLRGVSFTKEEDAEAFLIADNRIPEIGGWEDPLLRDALADLAAEEDGLVGTGYDAADVDALLRDAAGDVADQNAEPDPAVPKLTRALVAKWGVQRGDLWTAGPHRILVGDSTYADDVTRLVAGARVDAVLTDPPYCSGGFQEADRRQGSVGTDRKDYRKIVNDTLSTRGYLALMKAALTLANAGVAYVFTDWRMWVNLFDLVESCGYGVRNMIVWDKGTPGMGVGWRGQHELILYGSRDDRKFDNRKAVGNVVAVSRTGNQHHTTEKPVAVLATILNVTHFAQVVFDPFLGSGSTILAAEQEKRTCLGMELDPEYVAVALERLSERGLAPVRVTASGS